MERNIRSSEKAGSSGKPGSRLPAYFIFVLIGGVCGAAGGHLIAEKTAKNENPAQVAATLLWLVLCVAAASFIQIIIHEAGHFLFGKLSGYKLVSFRIGRFVFVEDEGRIKLKRFKIAGTGGQCLMMPPGSSGNGFPYALYNLGGSIANMLTGIILLSIYLAFPDMVYISSFTAILATIGITFALMNGIPVRFGGMANDGFHAYSLGKDAQSRRAFWLQLYINGLLASGIRLRDMPEEWFELDENADLGNPLVCCIGVYRCSYLYDRKQFGEARELCEFLLDKATGMLRIHRKEILCELMFLEAVGECRKEEIERIYNQELKKYVASTSSYASRRRLLYAYELLVHNDADEARRQLSRFELAARRHPYTAEIESERELIEFVNSRA